LLSVYGSDHPGIVARFAGALAERDANITDLSCRLTTGDEPIYVLIAEVALPDGLQEQELRRVIDEAAAEAGVDATFVPIEVETL
jgi:glycine cleavage system transcriptional repressor